MLRVCLITLNSACFLLTGCGVGADENPYQQTNKVVSTSLCGDGYLQTFAPEAIAALSWQSRSPLSLATKEQKHLPQASRSSETVLKWANHFILFGPGESTQIEDHLPQTYELNWTESVKGVYENALALTEAIGVSDKAVRDWYFEITEFSQNPNPNPMPRILYLTPAGGSAGTDTFVDAVITLAGGQNINTAVGWHNPSIETLLSYKPDIIIKSFMQSNYHSRGHHTSPLLKTHFENTLHVEIAGKYWPCAGPGLLEATKILRESILNWHQKEAHLPKGYDDEA